VIKDLHNPISKSYEQLKEFILSRNFSWYWHKKSTLNKEPNSYDMAEAPNIEEDQELLLSDTLFNLSKTQD
jgi:hypothetical protein